MAGDWPVLCVGDDPRTLERTAAGLERESDRLAVSTAETRAGRDALASEPFAFVVCAHDEGDLDALRAIREVDDAPVVVVTPEDDAELAAAAVSAGATDCLRRCGSHTATLLANRVENAIEGHRAATDLQRATVRLEELHGCVADLVSATEREELFDRTLAAADRILPCDACRVADADGETVAARGNLDDGRPALRVPVDGRLRFEAVGSDPTAVTVEDRERAELLVTYLEQALNRLESEAELRTAHDRLRTVLENTTAIVYVKDLEGRYTLVNARYEEVLGMDREEIVGRTDYEIQDDRYAERVRENDRAAIEREEPVEVEEQARREDGVRTYFSVKVPLFEDGEPTGVCGISSDITELKRRERQLEREKERLDEFASVVSHDLRNPLSVARGHLELAREERDDCPHLEEVAWAHDRMAAIVDDLLALARSGRCIGETERLSLGDAARSSWASVSTGDASLVVDDDATIEADGSRLRDVFANLFANAVEHATDADDGGSSDDGEALTVRVGPLESGFYVEDDGAGIPPDRRGDALEPGYTTAEDGTGYGLAIVSDVAEAHGWSLRIAEADEGGARFEFRA